MNIINVIKERRSIRQFTGNIPEDKLLELLEISSYAPNHGLREPWSFIVLNSMGDWERLYTLTNTRHPYLTQFEKQLSSSSTFPTGIIVVCPVSDDPKVAREDLLATATFIQNFQLAAWEDNYGVVWRTLCIDKEFEKNIGIEDNQTVVGFLQAGTFVKNNSEMKTYRSGLDKKIKWLFEV